MEFKSRQWWMPKKKTQCLNALQNSNEDKKDNILIQNGKSVNVTGYNKLLRDVGIGFGI